MPDIDTASAASIVANRFEAAKRAGHTDVALRMSEVIALLPVLDAMAAGQADEGRVERWARAMCRAAGFDPDAGLEAHTGSIGGGGYFIPRLMWQRYEPQARAAMALADAEAAPKVTA